MMKKSGSIALGLIAVALLASNAQAQMCGCKGEKGGGMHGDGMMGKMGHQSMGMMQHRGGMPGCGMAMDGEQPMWKHLMSLGLDDKQKATLKALHSRTQKEMVKKGADQRIAEIELKDVLAKEPVDMKAAEAALKKQEALKTDMMLSHLKAHEEMKAALNPDQRKQLNEMMESGPKPGCKMMDGEEGHASPKEKPMHEHKH